MLSRFLTSFSLARTLLLVLAISLVVPVAIAAVFATTLLDGVVRRQTEGSLRVAANLAQAAIVEFLAYLKGRTLDVADDFYIQDALASRRFGAEVNHALGVSRSHIPESEELFLLSNTGRVLASSDAASIGRDDSDTQYFRAGLEGIHVGDIAIGKDDRAVWVVSAPVVDRRSGARLAVLANRIDPHALSSVTTGRRLRQFGIPDYSFRRGRTGELYVVNRNGFMITESRFIDEALLRTRVETLPVRAAMTSHTDVLGNYPDYRGVPVTGASAVIPPLGWVVVAELDDAEAVRPIRQLQAGLAMLGVGLVPVLGILALLVHRSVMRPMQAVLAADVRARSDGPRRGLLDPDAFRCVEWQRLVTGRNAVLAQLQEQSDHLRQQLDTERRYRGLQEADRRKDVFLATLAHELRTPLTAITASAHALTVLPPEDEPKRQKLRGIIGHQATNIAKLVDELLDVSRVVSGKLTLRMQRSNLGETLRRVIDMIQATGRVPETQIALEERATSLIVMADTVRLEQVFRNLIDNAVKYSPPGAMVHVVLDRHDDAAVIRIRDSGIGIAPDDLPYIFDPFRQTAAAVRQAGGGLGLGLPLARGLVEQHGGRITVQSEGVGKGTEFEVRLPLLPSEGAV